MVGIPGQSKGCVTCRKRKIRCDEGKPTCLTCFRSRRTCEGYHRSKQGRQVSYIIDASRGIPLLMPTNTTVQYPSSPRFVSLYHGAVDFELFATTLDFVSPSDQPPNDMRMRQYFPEVLQRAASDGGALRLAVKAWSLAGLDCMKGCPSQRQLARSTYLESLYLLQRELKSGSLSVQTALACRVLGLYELLGAHTTNDSIAL